MRHQSEQTRLSLSNTKCSLKENSLLLCLSYWGAKDHKDTSHSIFCFLNSISYFLAESDRKWHYSDSAAACTGLTHVSCWYSVYGIRGLESPRVRAAAGQTRLLFHREFSGSILIPVWQTRDYFGAHRTSLWLCTSFRGLHSPARKGFASDGKAGISPQKLLQFQVDLVKVPHAPPTHQTLHILVSDWTG